jgi:hypothetical protein
MFPAGVISQFPDSNNSPYSQCIQSSNGLLTTTSITCDYEIMPPGTLTRSVFILKIRVFTFSVTLPLPAFSASTRLFFRRAPYFLSQTPFSHLTVSSSVIH